MMSNRFLRNYRLQIGKKGETKGVSIVQPIRMSFDIEKTTESNPNESTIKIYNLSPATRALIEKPDMRCVLYAGYEEEGEPLRLCSGDIAYAYSYLDAADWITELAVLDGLIEIRDTAVSLGYAGGVNSTQILNAIAGAMGLILVAPNSLSERKWVNGFSFYGAARTALDKVVSGTGLEWSVQNGELQIVNRANVTKRQAVVLSVESGLISYPERTREAAKSKKADKEEVKGAKKRNFTLDNQARDGWNVRSFLLPQVNPADKVKLESKTVTGWFRAEKVHHYGDSFSGDWITELHLIDLETKQNSNDSRKHRKKRV